jgi:hypothetical protein
VRSHVPFFNGCFHIVAISLILKISLIAASDKPYGYLNTGNESSTKGALFEPPFLSFFYNQT